jgi:hypothetical protein
MTHSTSSPNKPFGHHALVRFQIALDGFGNKIINIIDPALLHHVLRLLPELVGDFGFYGGGHGGYASGKLTL